MAQPRTAGDYTGNVKREMQREAQAEQAEAAATMSMASAAEAAEQRDGVFDPQSQARIDDPGDQVEVVPPEFPENGGSFFRAQPQERTFTGKETDEEIDEYVASQPGPGMSPMPILRSPRVKVRVNQDVEKMTYGMLNGEPNNFNFKEGFVYEVDVEIAEHLNQRGLVGQWVG